MYSNPTHKVLRFWFIILASYDYGAPIAENRDLTTKFAELKRQGLFLRSSPEFYKTDYIGNTSTGAVTTDSAAVFGVLLKNPDTNASFYIVRQNDSTSTYAPYSFALHFEVNNEGMITICRAIVDFKLNVTTSKGALLLPQVATSITLGGRESKVIATDYAFGSSKVLYTTAQVLFAGQIGGRDVLYLYGNSTQEHEVSLVFAGTPRIQAKSSSTKFTTTSDNETIVTFLAGIEGLVTVYDSDEQLVLYSDKDTAATFWAPVIPSTETTEFPHYWQLGTNASILVGGPYLVRNATITGSHLALTGDLKTGVRLFVFGPPNISLVTWNGDPASPDLALTANTSSQGVFVGSLETRSSASSLSLPKLEGWKFADSLPEITSNFSDAEWITANHTTTNIPYKPYYGDGRILYGCDYGL